MIWTSICGWNDILSLYVESQYYHMEGQLFFEDYDYEGTFRDENGELVEFMTEAAFLFHSEDRCFLSMSPALIEKYFMSGYRLSQLFHIVYAHLCELSENQIKMISNRRLKKLSCAALQGALNGMPEEKQKQIMFNTTMSIDERKKELERWNYIGGYYVTTNDAIGVKMVFPEVPLKCDVSAAVHGKDPYSLPSIQGKINWYKESLPINKQMLFMAGVIHAEGFPVYLLTERGRVSILIFYREPFERLSTIHYEKTYDSPIVACCGPVWKEGTDFWFGGSGMLGDDHIEQFNRKLVDSIIELAEEEDISTLPSCKELRKDFVPWMKKQNLVAVPYQPLHELEKGRMVIVPTPETE